MEPGFWRRMGEQRRYFPEWTADLLDGCVELEADHNSYLAGGYAEEFGYRAQPGGTRGVAVLDGESPDSCEERQCQAQALHPGYPIRPHPFELQWISEQWRAGFMRAPQGDYGRSSQSEDRGAFVPVSQRPYERQRHAPAQRAAAISRRLAAALISLRWTLGR